MTTVAELLHGVRDRLLLVISALERDDEIAAADQIEQMTEQARRDLDELRKESES